MITTEDFTLAVSVMDWLVDEKGETSFPSKQFNHEYDGQPIVTTALKILHKAVTEGDKEQQNLLVLSRHKITTLNTLLSSESFLHKMGQIPGTEAQLEVKNLKDFQIAVPPTDWEKGKEAIERISGAVAATLIDLSLLPVAGVLLLISLAKTDFDPSSPKVDKPPILLIHGSGFNQSEWVLGRHFLAKEAYGSVFSLNYDGLVSNEFEKGIDDYALGKIREKILEIQRITGQNQVILIGHSMGGLIAGFYAEYFADQDGIDIEHVISIGTPWKGAPILNCLAEDKKPKRYQQMSVDSSFRQELVAKALHSERTGVRKYYSIGGVSDFAAPAPHSNLTEDPRRQRTFTDLGHYGLIAFKKVWMQVNSWLDAIYTQTASKLG